MYKVVVTCRRWPLVNANEDAKEFKDWLRANVASHLWHEPKTYGVLTFAACFHRVEDAALFKLTFADYIQE